MEGVGRKAFEPPPGVLTSRLPASTLKTLQVSFYTYKSTETPPNTYPPLLLLLGSGGPVLSSQEGLDLSMNPSSGKMGLNSRLHLEKVPVHLLSGSQEEQISSDGTQVQRVMPLTGCKLAQQFLQGHCLPWDST